MRKLLQEDAITNSIKSQKQMWGFIVAIFFIITKIIIPLIRLIIDRKWYRQIAIAVVFCAITWVGIAVPSLIIALWYDILGGWAILISIPFYTVCVPYAIYKAIGVTKRIWRYFHRNDSRHCSPTNPYAPSELYDYEDED